MEHEIVEDYTLDDKFNYITDDQIRELAQELIDKVTDWGPKQLVVEAIRDIILIKYKGRVLGYLAPRRKSLLVYTQDQGGKWTLYRVASDAGLEAVLVDLKAKLDHITGSDGKWRELGLVN